MLSARDIREFRGFLRQATNRQVQGIYDKEKRAGRDDYAELAVAEAERRGIMLDEIGHSTKRTKSPAQLEREIAEALRGSTPPLSRRKRVRHFSETTDKKGDTHYFVTYEDRSGHEISRDELQRYRQREQPRERHATIKTAVPGVAKWTMSAGGTGAAPGKHGYSYRSGIKGEYHIWPYTTKHGRHAGYSLKYAATGGQPRGSHGGLWHELGTFKSPARAAKAARDHYTKSFE